MSSEQTKQHTESLRHESEISVVNRHTYRNDYRQSFSGRSSHSQAQGGRNMGNSVIRNCKYCGGNHLRGKRPAYRQVCHRCNKEGHFCKVCLSTNKSVNLIESKLDFAESEIDNPNFVIDIISIPVMSISDNTNSWDAQLKSNGTFVKYKARHWSASKRHYV